MIETQTAVQTNFQSAAGHQYAADQSSPKVLAGLVLLVKVKPIKIRAFFPLHGVASRPCNNWQHLNCARQDGPWDKPCLEGDLKRACTPHLNNSPIARKTTGQINEPRQSLLGWRIALFTLVHPAGWLPDLIHGSWMSLFF